MNKKRILQVIAMVLLLSMMLSTAAFAMPVGHVKQQMKNNYKYEDAFKHMKDKGIMYGYGNGVYGLGENVKRSDVTVMIVRAFKLSMMDKLGKINDNDNDDDYDYDFLDLIDKNSYYYNAVKTAKKLGIAKGDGKNFHPNKNVTYEEAILLIERAVKVANSNVTVLDDDGDEIKLRDWYKELVKDEKDAFRELLYELLEDEGVKEFKEPAKREDIALMLYHVLTGKDYEYEDKNEIKDIKLYLEDFRGKFSNIKTSVFRKAFEEIEDDSVVEYLIFGDISSGELHYKYNAKKPTGTEIDDEKYYFNNDDKREIKDLTFVSGKDNTSYIDYKAYIEEDGEYIGYSGRIIISVADKDLGKIKVTIEKETETTFDFDELGFEDFIEKIKFSPKKDSEVTLEINGKELKDERYETNKIENITFIPEDDFAGAVEINYIAYDKEDISYTGIMKITVKEVLEIEKIEIDDYNEVDVIYFIEELEKADEEKFEVIDYVKFKLPEEGKLFIKYDDNKDYISVDKYDGYDLDEIKGLKYEPVDNYDYDDEITIFYTAYDKDTSPDKKYDGKIVIELEKIDD